MIHKDTTPNITKVPTPPSPACVTSFMNDSLDPDLLPVPPALILNALALTPVDRSGNRSPAIVKRTSWIQNENSLPLDGFVSLDPRFNYFPSYHSKFPKPSWPKSSPTIPTSFFKDHRRKKKVGGSCCSLQSLS